MQPIDDQQVLSLCLGMGGNQASVVFLHNSAREDSQMENFTTSSANMNRAINDTPRIKQRRKGVEYYLHHTLTTNIIIFNCLSLLIKLCNKSVMHFKYS